MSALKFLATIAIGIIYFPLNWFAAYKAGTWVDVATSFFIPTYGLFYWGLHHRGMSFLFGIIGAGTLCGIAKYMNRDVL